MGGTGIHDGPVPLAKIKKKMTERPPLNPRVSHTRELCRHPEKFLLPFRVTFFSCDSAPSAHEDPLKVEVVERLLNVMQKAEPALVESGAELEW